MKFLIPPEISRRLPKPLGEELIERAKNPDSAMTTFNLDSRYLVEYESLKSQGKIIDQISKLITYLEFLLKIDDALREKFNVDIAIGVPHGSVKSIRLRKSTLNLLTQMSQNDKVRRVNILNFAIKHAAEIESKILDHQMDAAKDIQFVFEGFLEECHNMLLPVSQILSPADEIVNNLAKVHDALVKAYMDFNYFSVHGEWN